MILWVAGLWGVYRIFPISRGFRACQIILDMGLESMFFIRLLQYGAGTQVTGKQQVLVLLISLYRE